MAEDTASHERPPVGRLVLTLKGQTVTESYLVPGRLFVGRTADNDLQVDSRYVSRRHAQFITNADGTWVEDLNSTNGVFIRGKRVRRHRLQPGDIVDVGVHQIAYFAMEAQATATALLPHDEEEDDEERDEVEDEREA
jgi:pSer/pThr/pTyr-binding forkhead associated (FHA) protein